MKIKKGQINDAILIMKEAAQWLIDINEPLWEIDDFDKKKITNGLTEENFVVGYINDGPAAAMILQWEDKFFWPNINKNQSGFIHKLSVKRKFAGQDLAKKLINYAEKECKNKNINYLRLDCAGDRPKLCSFYEKNGFYKVDRRMVGIYDVAFYEKKIKK